MKTKKCILIGNSSDILKYEYGEGIDEFNTIVRFNRFRINEWGSKIGTRCTEWNINFALTINQNYFIPNFQTVKNEVKDLSCVKLVTTSSIPTNKIEHIKEKINFDFQYITPQPHWPELNFGYKPSTGLVSIFHYLDIFEQIYIHGFSLGQEEGPHHYWKGNTSADKAGKHIWSKEKEVVEDLIKKNKVIVYEQ